MTTHYTWPADEIIRLTKGHSLHDQNWHATGIVADLETLKSGDLFVVTDHQSPLSPLLFAALEKGAVGALLDRPCYSLPPSFPLLLCDEIQPALRQLALAHRTRLHSNVIGVMGSYGKASSLSLLNLCLAPSGSLRTLTCPTEEITPLLTELVTTPLDTTYLTLPLSSLLEAHLAHELAVAHPTHVLITRLDRPRSANGPTLEKILERRASTFQAFHPTTRLIFNLDNPSTTQLIPAARQAGLKSFVTFGLKSKGDTRVLSRHLSEYGTELIVDVMGTIVTLTLATVNEQALTYALGALTTAATVGADLETAVAALKEYLPPKGRGGISTIAHGKSGTFTLIDDSSYLSLTSARHSLTILDAIAAPGGGRKMIAIADSLPFSDSPKYFREFMNEIKRHKIDSIHCCGTLMKDFYQQIPTRCKGFYADSPDALASLIIEDLHNGDIISVNGNHHSNMSLITEQLKNLGPSRHH